MASSIYYVEIYGKGAGGASSSEMTIFDITYDYLMVIDYFHGLSHDYQQ